MMAVMITIIVAILKNVQGGDSQYFQTWYSMILHKFVDIFITKWYVIYQSIIKYSHFFVVTIPVIWFVLTNAVQCTILGYAL